MDQGCEEGAEPSSMANQVGTGGEARELRNEIGQREPITPMAHVVLKPSREESLGSIWVCFIQVEMATEFINWWKCHSDGGLRKQKK